MALVAADRRMMSKPSNAAATTDRAAGQRNAGRKRNIPGRVFPDCGVGRTIKLSDPLLRSD